MQELEQAIAAHQEWKTAAHQEFLADRGSAERVSLRAATELAERRAYRARQALHRAVWDHGYKSLAMALPTADCDYRPEDFFSAVSFAITMRAERRRQKLANAAVSVPVPGSVAPAPLSVRR